MVLTDDELLTLSLVSPTIQDTACWHIWEIITNEMGDDDATWARGMGHIHLYAELVSFTNEMLEEFGLDVGEEEVVDQCEFIVESAFSEGANQEAIAAWMFQSMENGRANAFHMVMAVSDIPVVGRSSLSHAIKQVIEDAKSMRYYGLYEITTKEGRDAVRVALGDFFRGLTDPMNVNTSAEARDYLQTLDVYQLARLLRNADPRTCDFGQRLKVRVFAEAVRLNDGMGFTDGNMDGLTRYVCEQFVLKLNHEGL
jgi:hypothetical protein